MSLPAANAVPARERAHEAAIAALAQSPVPALLQTVDAIQKALLATDPAKLRRSVGWWGRIIGRDIGLHAEAQMLREQLDVLVRRAQEQLAAVRDYRAELSTCNQALHVAIERLQAAQPNPSDAEPAAAPHAPMMAHAWRITAAHLQTVIAQYDVLLVQLAQSLPQVQALLQQDRMLADAQARAVRSAHDSAQVLRGLLADASTLREQPAPHSTKE